MIEGHHTAAEWANVLCEEPQQASPILSVQELVRTYPKLRPAVIEGLIRQGETMNIIAPPKTGKSWLAIALALSVAIGRRWLDSFATVAGNVLIIDNELHTETIANRIPRVADCLGVDLNAIAGRLSVLSLRGRLRDIFSLNACLDSIEHGRFALIVLDAFYRSLPPGTSENDNATMANIYNQVDALADRLGCCFVLIHHSTKGSQSEKSVTDVGAGAGSQSRATDTHLIMRQHEEPGAVVLEAAVRSWPPVQAVSLRWQFPLWIPATDLDPSALRTGKPPRRKTEKVSDKPKPPEWTLDQFVGRFISQKPASMEEIREAARNVPGLSWRRVNDLMVTAESQGKIHRWVEGRSHRVRYASVPQPQVEEAGR